MKTVCLAGSRGLMFEGCRFGLMLVTLSTSPQKRSAAICTTL